MAETQERDLFSTGPTPAQAGIDAPAPTTARTLVPLSSPPTERSLMSAAGQPTPPGSQFQTMAAPASSLAPPNGSSGAPGPGTTPGAAPGTTTAPVVAAPTLSQVQKNETVQGQLQELLSSTSPVLKQARDRAIVQSASRGLQNSTLAAQAGTEALISAATPIAATDAATFSDRAKGNQAAQNAFGQVQQQGNIQKELSAQDHMQRLVEQAAAGDINSRLQLEQAGYNKELSAQENLQRLEQLSKEGDIQSSLALQQFNFSTLMEAQKQGYAIDLSNQAFQQNQQLLVTEYTQRAGLSAQEAQQEIARLNAQHANTLEEIAAQVAANGGADAAKWTRDLQQGYLNAVTQRQMSASQEIAAIYSTQGLSGSQQTAAVVTAQNRLRTDLAAIAAYFQQTPGWPTTGTGGTPAPAPGLSPTGPTPYAPGGNPWNTPPVPPYVAPPPYVRPPGGPTLGGGTRVP
jgi:hypothetical protein